MRVVTYKGAAVKRQRKIGEQKILLIFYNQPPLVVTPEEWEEFRGNLYYDANVRRKDVVRTI